MWSRSKSKAAKRFAPILDKKTAKTSGTEWLRYTETIKQIKASVKVNGFELSDEQAEEMKRNMLEETSEHLSRESVCMLRAKNVRTGEKCNAIVFKKSDGRLVLDWTHCIGCEVGKKIDFDFVNSFWKDDDHRGCDKVFYATS